MCIPWGGSRTLSQGCTLVSGLLLPCLCIPSLLRLATVWSCPLELREGHAGWSLFLTNKQQGIQKGFCAQEPHRVLLGFIPVFKNVQKYGCHDIFWVLSSQYSLSISFQFRAILCAISCVLYFKNPLYFIHLDNATQPQLFYKEYILTSKSIHIKCYKMNVLKSLNKSI